MMGGPLPTSWEEGDLSSHSKRRTDAAQHPQLHTGSRRGGKRKDTAKPKSPKAKPAAAVVVERVKRHDTPVAIPAVPPPISTAPASASAMESPRADRGYEPEWREVEHASCARGCDDWLSKSRQFLGRLMPCDTAPLVTPAFISAIFSFGRCGRSSQL